MKFLRRLAMAVLILAVGGGGSVAWWLHAPLSLASDPTDLSIEPGTTPRGVANAVAAAGVRVDPRLLYAWFRLSGEDRQIRAGSYELGPGITPRSLLSKLVRGEEALRAVTLVEGWNFRQVREALAKADQLRPSIQGMTDDAVMAALDRATVPAEGSFFPDTYTYSKGSSDLAVLRRAMRSMDRRLDAAWAQRTPDTPLKSPREALVLASIVEKETGVEGDRPLVAGVFVNRLRAGMMLQTDPSVIYGMGPAYSGRLRKKDLQADTPWNTYTRTGLPPTPIAMPGRAALLAAVKPAPTQALYFVSRGDGSSHFSPSLDEHNKAVDRYIRGR